MQPFSLSARYKPSSTRMAVMGSGRTVVGNTPPRRPISAGTADPPRTILSPAMSLQRGDFGNVSTPQKFVHLVGCRDARPKPELRPTPAKR
jgi:hypothetical protein